MGDRECSKRNEEKDPSRPVFMHMVWGDMRSGKKGVGERRPCRKKAIRGENRRVQAQSYKTRLAHNNREERRLNDGTFTEALRHSRGG